MANRLTDSRKWHDPWFRKLPPEYKNFYQFITDICNHAGIWKPDFELAAFCIGREYTAEKTLAVLNKEKERILVSKNGNWFIPKFVEYQYKGELNPQNSCHKSVIDILKREGLEGAIKGLVSPLEGAKDKDKDKDKKDYSYSLDSKNKYKSIEVKKIDIEKLKEWKNKILREWNDFASKNPPLPTIRGSSPKRQECLSTRYKNKDFVDNWENVLRAIPKSPFLMGKNDRNWTVDFDFLIKNDENYQKILEGKYGQDKKKDDKL